MELSARLAQARRQLAEALALHADEARIEAQLLLQAALGGVSRAWLLTHGEQALTSQQASDFAALLQRRLHGEPVAYILGRREFYGLDIGVTPDVLIPRPDTETLVEAALQRIPAAAPSPSMGEGWGEGEVAAGYPSPQPSPTRGEGAKILDLGTGSGAIAIAIAVHRPLAMVTAVDASEAALAVARSNAERLAAGNLCLLRSDWFSALAGEVFDVIVSNPPYIAANDPHLSQGDLPFEPASALASGADGLDDIRRIVAQAPAHLASGGWLLLEHGYDQAARVAELLSAAGFMEVGHAADLAGILRVTQGRMP